MYLVEIDGQSRFFSIIVSVYAAWSNEVLHNTLIFLCKGDMPPLIWFEFKMHSGFQVSDFPEKVAMLNCLIVFL